MDALVQVCCSDESCAVMQAERSYARVDASFVLLRKCHFVGWWVQLFVMKCTTYCN